MPPFIPHAWDIGRYSIVDISPGCPPRVAACALQKISKPSVKSPVSAVDFKALGASLCPSLIYSGWGNQGFLLAYPPARVHLK
jgi:hypothetical protein